VEAFLLSRRVCNCSSRTLEVYATNLLRFQRASGIPDMQQVSPLLVQRHVAGLRERMKPISAHQHFRTLRTFFA